MKKLVKATGYSVVAILFSIALSGCGYNQDNSNNDTSTQTGVYNASDDTSLDDSPTFHGDTCTDDCSGHEAGYNWAEEQGITSPDDCGGNSSSFIEGCESYAEENGEY